RAAVPAVTQRPAGPVRGLLRRGTARGLDGGVRPSPTSVRRSAPDAASAGHARDRNRAAAGALRDGSAARAGLPPGSGRVRGLRRGVARPTAGLRPRGGRRAVPGLPARPARPQAPVAGRLAGPAPPRRRAGGGRGSGRRRRGRRGPPGAEPVRDLLDGAPAAPVALPGELKVVANLRTTADPAAQTESGRCREPSRTGPA